MDYWRDNPPLHLLMRGNLFFGMGGGTAPSGGGQKPVSTDAEVSAFLNDLAGLGGG